jgi:hypothetical protein
MALITTGNHPKALWPGIKAWWGRKYNEHDVEYTGLFDMEGSSRHYEEDVEVTGFGLAPIKKQGVAVEYDDELQGTISRYIHVAYALGYIVTKEELDDNLYEVVSKRRSQALAFSMRQTKENVAALIYNRAFNAAFTGGDGQALIVTTHPSISGNQANRTVVAADLSEAALEDMITLIGQARNSRGLKIALKPTSLIIPIQEFWNANRILKSVQQSGTANNDPNVLKMVNAIPGGIKVNHYLTDPDAWFLRTNAPRGMVGYDRVPIQFTKDTDFDTENAKAKAYERYVFGWTDWRGIYGSPGA